MTALRLLAGGSGNVDPDVLAFDRWQTDLRGLRPNTVRVRGELLARLSTFLGKPLREATEGDLLRWERAFVARRATASRHAYVSHVKCFYTWAKGVGIVSEDPSELLTSPVVPRRRLPRSIDEDDLAAAILAARPKLRAMLTLAAYAGLRPGEIAGLDWGDLRRETDGTFLRVRSGRTGGHERRVQLDPAIVRALKGYRVGSSGAVFPGRKGGGSIRSRCPAPAAASSPDTDWGSRWTTSGVAT